MIRLPYPPALNHYYRFGRGHFYISAEGQKYRQTTCAIVRQMYLPRLSGPVKVGIVAVLPDKRRRDIDGLLKCLLDSLGHAGLYEDDSQIVKLSIEKRHRLPNEEAHLEVEIEPLAVVEAWRRRG